DMVRRDRSRGTHQVSLVLPILVIRHDDHPPLANVLDGLLYPIKGHGPSHPQASLHRSPHHRALPLRPLRPRALPLRIPSPQGPSPRISRTCPPPHSPGPRGRGRPDSSPPAYGG